MNDTPTEWDMDVFFSRYTSWGLDPTGWLSRGICIFFCSVFKNGIHVLMLPTHLIPTWMTNFLLSWTVGTKRDRVFRECGRSLASWRFSYICCFFSSITFSPCVSLSLFFLSPCVFLSFFCNIFNSFYLLRPCSTWQWAGMASADKVILIEAYRRIIIYRELLTV